MNDRTFAGSQVPVKKLRAALDTSLLFSAAHELSRIDKRSNALMSLEKVAWKFHSPNLLFILTLSPCDIFLLCTSSPWLPASSRETQLSLQRRRRIFHLLFIHNLYSSNFIACRLEWLELIIKLGVTSTYKKTLHSTTKKSDITYFIVLLLNHSSVSFDKEYFLNNRFKVHSSQKSRRSSSSCIRKKNLHFLSRVSWELGRRRATCGLYIVSKHRMFALIQYSFSKYYARVGTQNTFRVNARCVYDALIVDSRIYKLVKHLEQM